MMVCLIFVIGFDILISMNLSCFCWQFGINAVQCEWKSAMDELSRIIH